jgi:hypothetical protein
MNRKLEGKIALITGDYAALAPHERESKKA